MNHWVFLPMALPLAAAALVLFCGGHLGRQRLVSVLASAALLAVSVRLLMLAATGEHEIYLLGNWPAPYGIVLVLDRLAALMLVLSAVVGLACVVASLGGWDARGRHFHALVHLQLFGLNGAFLTGDLFNLFVFFEVLLIASYGLLLHGGGGRRAAAATHYVVFNLAASTLFLFAVSLLYAMTGTLNMADLALRVAGAAPEDAALIRAAGLMLFVVFAVKAAVLPLSFWLQNTYTAASAPVAVLFAIMTKVGFYSILRVYTLVFGHEAGVAALLVEPWLMPLALATLVVASVGVLASRDLTLLATYLVVVAVGTQLLGVATFTERGVAAALYYMAQSTLALALFFLLADRIGARRGGAGTRLIPATLAGPAALLALLYLGAAIAVAGLPPLAGFVGKTALLQSVADHAWRGAAFATLLASSLLVVFALARSGSLLFWKGADSASAGATPAPAAAQGATGGGAFAVGGLAAAMLALTALAQPAYDYMQATAQQLVHPAAYIERVLTPGATDRMPDPDRLRALRRGGAT